jgi:hypothetical protein
MKNCPNCSTLMEVMDVSVCPSNPPMTQRSLAFQECGLHVQAANTLKRVILRGLTCNP